MARKRLRANDSRGWPAAGGAMDDTIGCTDEAAHTRHARRAVAYPFTQTTCRSVCTTSTRLRCAAITASMSL